MITASMLYDLISCPHRVSMDLFAERGIGHAPTSAIAAAAGVAEGTLFTYFKTKDELLNELYRELTRRGVSEYLVAPLTPLQLIETISNLYVNPSAPPIGRVIVFAGGRGGASNVLPFKLG